jgi:hypothetical protein
VCSSRHEDRSLGQEYELLGQKARHLTERSKYNVAVTGLKFSGSKSYSATINFASNLLHLKLKTFQSNWVTLAQ